MKKIVTLLLMMLLGMMWGKAQPLNAGDVALMWYNTNTDEFGFVTFVDLQPGRVIYFTDRGATDGSPTPAFVSGTTNDGVLSFTVGANVIPAGTIIDYPAVTGGQGTFGVALGNFGFDIEGDQLFIFDDIDLEIILFGLNAASQDLTDACDPTLDNETDSPNTLIPTTFSSPSGSATPGTFLALGNGSGVPDPCTEPNLYLWYNGGTVFQNFTNAQNAITDPDNWLGGSTAAEETALSNRIAVLTTAGALPIELTFFTANPQDNQVLLNWQTATEINNDRFEVERSRDGGEFSPIAVIDGAGTSYETKNYAFTDVNPIGGISYYRLKQVDFDGTIAYSDIVSVLMNGEDRFIGEFFPNPSITGSVNLDYVAVTDEPITIEVYDVNGRLVYSEKKEMALGANRMSFNFERLSKGVFTTRIQQGQNQEIRRLIIN
ncbi:MAG: T9SS type A sorting domain-containing protein [Bacteroidota bacterium]